MSRFGQWALLCASAVLVSCGGGSGSPSALPSPQSAVVSGSLCDSASGDYERVGAQCVQSAPLMRRAPAGASLQPQAVPTITATQLLDWAETAYAAFFSSRQPNLVAAPYTYRYYPGTQNYLGVAGEDVYVLGPAAGGNLVRVGSLADFACQVQPSGCAVPGAPTIGAATAGSASASIAFTAPSSGAPIIRYTASCTGSSALAASGTATTSPITVSGLTNGTAYSCTVTATNSSGTSVPSAAVSVTPAAASTGVTVGTSVSTASLLCPYSASVFNSTLNLTASVAMSCSNGQRQMSGTGVPDHTPGTFPNANNPSRISTQTVRFTSSLTPAVATATGTAVDHVVGYANNGIKFDPATAESYQNAGVWKIEALGQTYVNLGADSSNAHVQPDGAYHYHGMPEGFVTRQNKGTAMTLVGFALDGFPIYARYGYVTATSASSGTRVMTPSWRLKTTPSSGRPSTTAVPMGTFTQDYEYVAGLGDLDECNGRVGVTPEFPSGTYHYFITDGWPYIQRCIKGTPVATGSGPQ